MYRINTNRLPPSPAAAANREEQMYQTLTNDCTTNRSILLTDEPSVFASRRIDKLQFLCTRRLLNSVESYGIKLKKKYQTRTQNISYSLSLAGWPFIERCDTPSSFLVSTHDPQQKRRESRNSPVGFKVTQSRDLYILL